MNRDATAKVTRNHLDKLAYVYIRQSSLYQVENHVEGRLRQYNLVEWAQRAGWPQERILIIDSDLGKSSASPNSRSGFGELIAAVGRGEAGIVVALEATRLARNSLDWHNLIYMCRWTATLIADENSVYDPADSSDRMVLGIRGQMSEMELENSIGRMIKARWNKARRGEFLVVPPAGFEIDENERIVMSNVSKMSPLPPRGKEAQSLPVPRNGRDECGPTMPRPFTGGAKSKTLEAAACHKPLTAVSIISRTIA